MLVITYDTGLQEVVYPHFQIGEVVAISQPYESFISHHELCERGLLTSAGAHNSMFVKADLMPNRIRIINVKVERLRSLTNDECLREGIRQSVIEYGDKKIVQWTYFSEKRTIWYDSPREAFAALIDRINGRGAWQRNEWQFAYTFKLIK